MYFLGIKTHIFGTGIYTQSAKMYFIGHIRKHIHRRMPMLGKICAREVHECISGESGFGISYGLNHSFISITEYQEEQITRMIIDIFTQFIPITCKIPLGETKLVLVSFCNFGGTQKQKCQLVCYITDFVNFCPILNIMFMEVSVTNILENKDGFCNILFCFEM